MSEFLKILLEIFNHNAPGEWVIDGDDETKTFTVNGEQYRIACVKDAVDKYNFVRISFTHLSEDGPSLDLTNLNNGSGKVLATVMNSVWDRFKNSVNVFVFSSKDTPARTRVYSKIASHLAMTHALEKQTVNFADGGAIFALSKTKIELDLKDFV